MPRDECVPDRSASRPQLEACPAPVSQQMVAARAVPPKPSCWRRHPAALRNGEHAPDRSCAACEDLRTQRMIGPEHVPRFEVLQGGVSNKTVLVEPHGQPPFVVKQALGKLRVAADWHCDPARIHREASGLRSLLRITPPGT